MKKLVSVVLMLAVFVSGCASMLNDGALGDVKQSFNKLKGNFKGLVKGSGPKTPADLTTEADEIMNNPNTLTNPRIDKALSNYDTAIKVDPNYAPAYKGRGMMKAVGKRNDLAYGDFKKACELGDNESCEFVTTLEKQGIK